MGWAGTGRPCGPDGPLAGTVALFLGLDTIDLSVVVAIYVPIYVVVLAPLLFGQYVVGYALALATALGLMAEYGLRWLQPGPTMAGASLNTAILLLGLLIGVVVQVVVAVVRRG